jgi:hypothetical protein
MRKRYRVLLFAALSAALVAPVGFALSLGSAPWIAQTHHPIEAAIAVTAPAVWVVGSAAVVSVAQEGFDAAGLLLVGTGLFGLAAIVRKTI